MTSPGPAIIEENFTTIVVYPGWNARLDDAGDYELVAHRQQLIRLTGANSSHHWRS